MAQLPEIVTVEAPTDEQISDDLARSLRRTTDSPRPVRRYLAMWRGTTGNFGRDASRHIHSRISTAVDSVDSVDEFATKYESGIKMCATEISREFDVKLIEGLRATFHGLAPNLRGLYVEAALADVDHFGTATEREDFAEKIDLWFDGRESVQLKPASAKQRIHHYAGDFDILGTYAQVGDTNEYVIAFERSGDEKPAYSRAKAAAVVR